MSFPTTANNSLSPKLKWHNSRMRVEFKGSCLTQDKVTNVIYMLLCTNCRRKCIRETDNLERERTYNSKSHLRASNSKP